MSLSHSNIAQVLDLGECEGRYFLALELVDGWDLGRVLNRAAAAGVRLRRALALHITADVCRALGLRALQEARGRIRSGSSTATSAPTTSSCPTQGEVKLTDFGIAKAMNKREHTWAPVVKGKVAFMSPEQATGRRLESAPIFFPRDRALSDDDAARPFEGPSDWRRCCGYRRATSRRPNGAPGLNPEVDRVVARRWARSRTSATRTRTRCWPTSSGSCGRVSPGRADRAPALADRALGARRGTADQPVDGAHHGGADQHRHRRAGRRGRRPPR